MGAQDVVTITVRLPRKIWEAARASATSVNLSMNAFVNLAVAQRVRNWEDPVSGKKVRVATVEHQYTGWYCDHSACGGSAISSCKGKQYAHHRSSGWHNDELGYSYPFDKWAHERGVVIPGTEQVPDWQEEPGPEPGIAEET